MAQTTPNFGFNIAEGTDTVNLLTQCYPNFTSLDSILQAIKETGVTTAVATKTGTNFAVVRTDTDCNFFRFIATANYAAGDTFTVDGVAVTATSPAGTALPAGAFVINQSVIGVVNSSVLTLFVGGGASTVDAEDVDYDNSGSGLIATDVQAAIDEVVSDIPTGFAATAITYDNTLSGLTATTAQTAIDELAAGGSDPSAFGTKVSILGYAWPTPFVAPSDGYVAAMCWGNNSNVVAKIYGSNATAESDTNTTINYTNGTVNYYETTVFVKKGMKMFGGGRAGNGAYSLDFIPLV